MFDSWKLFAIVSFACLSAAQAKEQTIAKQFVDLKYDMDPALQGCPTALDFRSIVAQELGYDPHLPGSSMGLAIRVRATATGLEGVIKWGNTGEKKVVERRFAARTEECRAMMTTVGFVVAVQIQLAASENATEPIPLSALPEPGTGNDSLTGSRRLHRDGTGQAAVALTMRSFELYAAPVSKGAEWITTVGVGPAIGIGLAPSAVGLVRLFGAVQRGWLGLEVGAEASQASATRQAYGNGFRHHLELGTLAGCAWHGPFSACALGKLGRVQVQGVGVDVPASPKGAVAEAGPRIAYSLGIDQHLTLQGHLEALCTLTSWTVNVNRVAAWTMPRFATVAGIDLAARF
jgi:hypothetical protein